MTEPTEASQIEVLLKIQRLLAEGSFTASYKYALLQALADLSVEKAAGTDGTLLLGLGDIAEKFIHYYWRQVLPYVPGAVEWQRDGARMIAEHAPAYGPQSAPNLVLRQNTKDQARVLSLVARYVEEFEGSLPALRADTRRWTALRNQIAAKIVEMPLYRLQRIGSIKDAFLYDEGDGRSPVSAITLRPGVGFTLARFHGLIQELVRSAWSTFVRGLPANRQAIGETTDLYEFLFGSSRAPLGRHQPILQAIQSDACFYCQGPLKKTGVVDHFIPWMRYPVDLGHNFVLAHTACNGSKSNILADVGHLERWWMRNQERGHELAGQFDAQQIPHDVVASRAITCWAYGQVERVGSRVWRSRTAPEVPLDAAWREIATFCPSAETDSGSKRGNESVRPG